jgi:hypothetical protein
MHKCENNIEMDVIEIYYENVKWIKMFQNKL